MAGYKHIRYPIWLNKKYGYIGEIPNGSFGRRMIESHRYMRQWYQGGQLFTYSGPPDKDISDSPDGGSHVGKYYVIIPSRTRSGASNTRYLQGVLMPWCYNAPQSGGVKAHIKWQMNGGTQYTLYESYGVSDPAAADYGDRLGTWFPTMFELCDEDFSYTPDSADWVDYGVLETKHIQTAALGIWYAPDFSLASDNARFSRDSFSAGKYIRGYGDATAGDHRSLGEFIRYTNSDMDYDNLMHNTNNILWQWGHPSGVWMHYTDSGGSYLELCTGARYRVWDKNYLEESSGVSKVLPAFVATTQNASEATPAALKITSTTAADTWEKTITTAATTTALYVAAGSGDDLDIDNNAAETIKIEIKPGDDSGTPGYFLLHSVALIRADGWYS